MMLYLMWFLQGIAVGFGAILPGISGGTLCVAFGMYRPMIETLSNLKTGLKKHGIMLAVFLAGVLLGFIGLSGVASYLLDKSSTLVTCAFVGFIAGTLPDLWSSAGELGRKPSSYITLAVCFAVMLTVLILLNQTSILLSTGIAAYLFCGLLWGLSIVVPGLSSSSLLLFFGLYQPMLEGISRLDMGVLLPLLIGIAACIVLLSKGVGYAFEKFYPLVSHGVLGIVAATVVILIPLQYASLPSALLHVGVILAGAAVSYALTGLCNRLKAKYGAAE